jgi:dTDP-4-dehydrorhamnose reductase
MKILITGQHGTVGRALVPQLHVCGDSVVGWDRERVPIDQYHAMEAFVRRAWITRVLDIRFLFTSTAMVFSDHAPGPFSPTSVPDAEAGYGHEKRRAEARVMAQNPRARVVRLGWQIGEDPNQDSNNMLAHLERTSRREGCVRASRLWLPATSFLSDTAAALRRLLEPGVTPGIYMIDANPRWSFFQIARALSRRHGNRWRIEPTDDFVYDQRMLDPRPGVPALETSLPELLQDPAD